MYTVQIVQLKNGHATRATHFIERVEQTPDRYGKFHG